MTQRPDRPLPIQPVPPADIRYRLDSLKGRRRPAIPQDPRTFSPGRPKLGFFGVCLGYSTIILDGSVLNVAVPAIRYNLGSSMPGVQWVLNGYTLTLAALLLTAGALGDRLGLRRVLLAGLLLFTLASAACAVSPNTAVLIAARVMQGVGAAALLPATLALIPHLFTETAARTRAAVVWVATGSIAVAVGPLVGGVLIDSVGWRCIFLINLPTGLVSVVLVWLSVPETPRHNTPVDNAGWVSAAAALALLTAGLTEAGTAGWAAPSTLGLIGGAVVAGTTFWMAAHRSRHPLLPPTFFAARVRAASVASAGLMAFIFYGLMFVMSLYFQQVRGWSPGRAGVAPLALYRPLSARFGHRVMLVAGFICCSCGTALVWPGPGSVYPVIGVGLLLVGVASTVVFSALTSLLMASVSTAQSGLASGVQNTARQGGALVAVSVLGALFNVSSLRERLPLAFTVLVIAALLSLTVGALNLRTRD